MNSLDFKIYVYCIVIIYLNSLHEIATKLKKNGRNKKNNRKQKIYRKSCT